MGPWGGDLCSTSVHQPEQYTAINLECVTAEGKQKLLMTQCP